MVQSYARFLNFSKDMRPFVASVRKKKHKTSLKGNVCRLSAFIRPTPCAGVEAKN